MSHAVIADVTNTCPYHGMTHGGHWGWTYGQVRAELPVRARTIDRKR